MKTKNRHHAFTRVCIGAGALLGLVGRAAADTLYFDTNGSVDGTNHVTNQQTWNSTTTDWSTDVNGDANTGLWVNGDDAVFSAGTNGNVKYTVSCGGNLSANSITIEEGTLTFLASATPPSRTIGAGGITLASTADGSVAFNTNANGTSGMTLIVGASQTWTDNHATGSFTANGVIKGTATAGNTFTLTTATNGSGDMVFTNVVSDGTGGGNLALAVTSTGTGRLNLQNANTYTGGTTVTSGTLLVSNTTGSATGSGTVTLNGGALASAAGDGTAITGTVGNVVAGTGAHTISPGGDGTLGRLATGDLTVSSNTTLKFDITDPAHLDQIVLPNNAFAFSGTGMAAVSVPAGLAAGTYVLVDYGSTALADTSNFAITGAPAGYSLSLDGGNTSLDLVVVAGGSVSASWNSAAGGSWGLSGNWTPSTPGGAGSTITFGSSLAGSDIVTLDGNRTVGHIVFNNGTASYNIGRAAGDTTSTLTIDNSGAGATGSPDITVTAGSHTISAPLVIPAGTTVTKLGIGTLTLSGAMSVSAGSGTIATIAATGGTTNFSTDPTSSVAISTSNAGTVVNFTGATDASLGSGQQVRNVAGLAIGAGSVVNLAGISGAATHANRTVLEIGSGGFTNSGKLDLSSNDLVVHNVAVVGTVNTVGSIPNQLKAGFAAGSGYWNGATGIVSTSAAADTRFLTTLGYATGGASGVSSFDNIAATASTDVLVKYTYYGDADLNGTLNGADYTKIDTGFGMGLSGWSNGDFNYDGVVNGADYALIDNTFNQITSSGASPLALVGNPENLIASSAAVGLVPEPATLGLFGVVAIGFVPRRRRRAGRSIFGSSACGGPFLTGGPSL